MKELVDYVSSETNIKNKQLIEKDIIIHSLLLDLSDNEYFKKRFAFKGGTCLTKCYYGYYRFSEDLDFSWISQEDFEGKSQKEIRRILSKEINEITQNLLEIAKKNLLDFKGEKSDKKYIELGGSNKFTTFKLWYDSEIMNTSQFIKIQINFVETFKFPFQKKEAKAAIEGISEKDFQFLFPEQRLLTNPRVMCYDIKEILIEKVRAILTRKGIKARDFIDVFMILNKEKIKLDTLKPQILDKIKFMLQYDKYIQNLENFRLEEFVMGDEEKLMLVPMKKGFEKFLSEFHVFLNELYEDLK